ncbi:MAG TPA: UvrD-helicase domain-containing protein, partial [Planctomycetaceae bacterium]|nr:UvrD-helicase domain-containing protein [Planctomycetaceae bacterium]
MPEPKRNSRKTAPAPTSDEKKSQPQELTGQQRAAICHRQTSIALSAGAGCGKTFVLTRRFLSHLDPGEESLDLSQLVAITFTERAAREMRDRIRKECRRILSECPASEVDYWLAIVRQLDTARISTIHSFCGSLLRSHAVEAALDPRFKLLDETTSGSLLRNAIEEGLHRLLSARDVDSHELVLEYGLDRTRALLEELTRTRYRIDFDAWRSRPAADLAAEWEKLWQTVALPRLLRELLESPTTRRLIQLLREHVPSHAVMQDRRQQLLDDLAALPDSDDPPAILERLQQNARVQGGGGKGAWDNDEVYALVQEVMTDFRDVVGKTRDQWEYRADDLVPAAEFGLRLLRVTEQVGRVYDDHKRAGAWLDFDDLLIGARNLLRDHPEVRRRVAAGIALLLVDEFQDTDPIQTEIVGALCGDDLLAGKLFVVGDVKQSIYRFRRAEPQVFRQLRQDIPEEGRLPLTTNFRSQPAILNFVNALFDGALGPEYEPLVPSCKRVSEEPTIEFLFSSAPADEVESADADDSADGRRRREAEWIARRLKQLLQDGKPRVREKDAADGSEKLRPLQQKDIVILFRAMTDVRFYEAALRDNGLDYYVVGGQAFFAQQEVFDLVNLCRALDDPDDEVAL